MQTSRRDFLLGAAAIAPAATLAGTVTAAQAQDRPVAVPGTPGALRLATFQAQGDQTPRIGVVRDDGTILDLAAAAARSGRSPSFDPRSMLSLIAAGAPALDEVRTLAAGDNPGLSQKDIVLMAPIPAPARNVYAVGWNYLEHFAEGQKAHNTDVKYPEHPVFFTKGTHTINGPYDPIPFDPAVSSMIDWEGELAVVIGRRGRNIAEADAIDHVFGFSVINDTTARDVQYTRHGGQWFKGKSLDGHGPMGPWIVVRGSLDPENLHLVTRVNGAVKQDANTSQMYFKVPRIIAELSLGLTLEAGDIIATGTPSGVGFARKPQEFLKPGDVMETEIAGIGLIRNEIKAIV